MKNNKVKQSNPDFIYMKDKILSIIDYDSESDNSACRCGDDYCRCGRIINTKINTNVNDAYNIACVCVRNKSLHDDLRFYCLERFISCVLRNNPDCFTVNVCSGYYGEETDGVSIDNETQSKINKYIDFLNLCPNSTDLVESILREEYGYILGSIKDKEWHMDVLPYDNIKSNNEIYKSTIMRLVNQYTDDCRSTKHWLSCLCKKVGDDYILVDGHHRYIAAGQRKDKKMTVVWCDI